MNDEWCAGIYATITLCIKRLLEEGDVPITHDLLSIFWYSFTCFRPSGFETTLNRTLDMTMAYREFYRMTRHMTENKEVFENVLMFILKGFPASAALSTCVLSDTYATSVQSLLQVSKQLLDEVMVNIEEYKENPSRFTEKAKFLYSNSWEGESVNTSVSSGTFSMNG